MTTPATRGRLAAAPRDPSAPAVRKPRRRVGPVERQTKRDIAALVTSHPMGEALTEIALTLAGAMDRIRDTGKNMMVLPATGRELRETLAELAGLAANDDDDDFADELSAPVRDTPES